MQEIEHRVNDEIRADHPAQVQVTTPEAALAAGAVGLFGEKYGSKVRVVHFGESVELCGGTHADATGNIGLFKIVSETAVAAGIRRIEAVTGDKALLFIEKRETEVKHQLTQADQRIRALEKDLQLLKDKLAESACRDLVSQAKTIGNIKVLGAILPGVDGNALRHAIDQLKNQLGSAVILLATVKDNKIGLVGGVTADLTEQYSAKEMVVLVASQVGGKGGGRADLAEGGGNQPEALQTALQSIDTWVQAKQEKAAQ